jgi:hypothetical protein
MAKLTSGEFPSVKSLALGAFNSELLINSGVVPRVAVTAVDGGTDASQLYTVWRSVEDGRLDLVYILNRGPSSTFYLSFSVSGKSVPYILDAWTGTQSRLLTYVRTDSGISASFTLATQQSTIVAFRSSSEESDDPLHVVSSSSNLARIYLDGNGQIVGLIDDANSASVLLSSNKQVNVPPLSLSSNNTSTLLPTINIKTWNLTVQSYAAPNTLSTSSVSGNLTSIPISTPLRSLVPWTRIPGLERASGIGTYRAAFTIPEKNGIHDISYTLHFSGKVLNTLRVWVNGALLPAVDIAAPADGRDITPLLRDNEENQITVEVSSTLFNAVKARMNDLKSVGMGVRVPRYYTQVQYAEFGLIGEVTLKSLRRVVLS